MEKEAYKFWIHSLQQGQIKKYEIQFSRIILPMHSELFDSSLANRESKLCAIISSAL